MNTFDLIAGMIGIVCTSAALLAAPPTAHPENLSIDNFAWAADASAPSRWTATPAVSISASAERGLEYRLISAEQGGTADDSRRATLRLNQPIDLTRYSRLCFDVYSETTGFTTVACTLYEPEPKPAMGWEARLWTVPSRQTHTFAVDLNKLGRDVDPMIDLSRIQSIAVGAVMRQYDPIVMRISNLRAEYDPSIGSPAEGLVRRAQELKQKCVELQSRVAWESLDPQTRDELKTLSDSIIGEVGGILAACEQGQQRGFDGKFNALNTRLAEIRNANQIGRLLLAGRSGLYLWNISPYINVYRDEFPDAASEPLKEIQISTARGEYRDAVFMVSSPDKDRRVRIALKSDNSLLNNTTLVQEALYVKATDGQPVGDAHFPLQDGGLNVPVNQSRQIRLRFDATTQGLGAGRHAFEVVITDEATNDMHTIPGQVEVWDFALPDAAEFMSNNTYAEFSGSTLSGLEEQMVRDMKAYGLNVFYVAPNDILAPADTPEERRFTFERLDEHVGMIMKNWGPQGPRPQFIFSLGGGVAPPPEQLAGWTKRFAEVMRRHGIDTDQWYFVFSDEVSEDGLARLELPLGEQMRAAAPFARITTNTSAILNDLSLLVRYFDTIDRREPELESVFQNPHLLPYLRLSDKPIALYRCRGDWTRRGANMYDYYRVYAWHAIREGAPGLGLWTYCADRNADPWNDKANIYSLVLRHPAQRDALVHTRRYETFREGIDDYRYVTALRRAAAAKGNEAQQRAEALIQEAIWDITAHPSDTTLCEKWRYEIARCILSLQ